jgi:hypothetical protein
MGIPTVLLWAVFVPRLLGDVRRAWRTASLVRDAPSRTIAAADGAAWLEVRLEGTEGAVTPAGTFGYAGRSHLRCAPTGRRRGGGGGATIREETSASVPFRVIDETGSAEVPAGELEMLHEPGPVESRVRPVDPACRYEEVVLGRGARAALLGCVDDAPEGRVVRPCGDLPLVLARPSDRNLEQYLERTEATLLLLCLPLPLLLLLATYWSSEGIELRRRRS